MKKKKKNGALDKAEKETTLFRGFSFLYFMAGSSLDSSFHCDTVSLRHIGNSFFHFSGSKVGVGAKGLSESESAWSPTSPLDFRFFSNLSNPFSVKSSRSSSQSGQKKQLECSKVGLGIINILDDETKLDNEVLGVSQRKNIIFGSQVKAGILKTLSNSHQSIPSYVKSSSLPKNYVISGTKNSKSEAVSFDSVSENGGFTWESGSFKNIMTSLPAPNKPSSSSSINTYQIKNVKSNDFCVENASSEIFTAPVSVGYLSNTQPSSLPISIDFSNGCVGSLSAREIELSEDYTCVISHGPNPKRTHIFGDCILECHKTDITQFSKKEEPIISSSQVSSLSDESANPDPSDNILSFCHSCRKKLEEGRDVYIYRFEFDPLIAKFLHELFALHG